MSAVPSASGGGGRADLSQVLQRHGLTEAAIRAVDRLGRNLRTRTEQYGVEFATMLDAESGVRLGSVLRGSASGVAVDAHLGAMRLGRSYVQLHTHPGSSSFSPSDGVILVTFPGIRVSAVIGRDRTWYMLSTASRMAPPTEVTVIAAYNAEVAALRAKYRARVRSGTATREQAWREHSHEVWQNIAPALGLRYDRLEGA